MIGWLQGKIIDKQHPGKIIVDVNGVGYDVETSLLTLAGLEGTQADVSIGLHIHTVIREDAFLLYGFLDKQDRSLFRALIKINGVGPKAALGIQSGATAGEFAEAVMTKNVGFLTKLPGIGKKTAERLVIEMKDSVLPFLQNEGENTGPSIRPGQAFNLQEQAEAISALEALGYKAQDAMKVVKKIDDGNQSCEQLIRQALQVLAGRF